MLIYVYYGYIHILMYIGVYVRVCSVSKLCLILCDSMDCSLPDSSVHGISQARILEWVAIAPSRGPSQWRTEPSSPVSCIGRQIPYHGATWDTRVYIHTYAHSMCVFHLLFRVFLLHV